VQAVEEADWGRRCGLGDSLHVESKWGKDRRSVSEGPQQWWHAVHLKKDGSGVIPVGLATGEWWRGVASSVDTAEHARRGKKNIVSYGGPHGETTIA
jgi:hypothetical protein